MDNKTFYKRLAAAVRAGSAGLYTVLSGENRGEKLLVYGGNTVAQNNTMSAFWQKLPRVGDFTGAPCTADVDGVLVLAENLVRRPRLVICGAGHISQPLAEIGVLLEFEVTVIDDREEFANSTRFPCAHRILCAEYAQALAQLEDNPNTYYVIITRGHSADRECLEAVLNRPNAYIGMIGSRNKTAVVMQQMLDDGYAKEQLDAVYAPIGLKIGAQTPAEIAVCIAAELVQVRRTDLSEGCIGDAMLDFLQSPEQPMVIATIVSKSGSAPRGMGAKMLLTVQGEILSGSTGGGAGEGQVCALAAQVAASGKPLTETCSMTNTDAKQAGMVCGGTITVLMEPI